MRMRMTMIVAAAVLATATTAGTAATASAATPHSRAAAVTQAPPPGPSGNRTVRRTPKVVPAALGLSPGCSSEVLPIDCLITEPVVTTKQTPYPLSFQRGDHVTVSGGGCVQTGGIGATWKRYVDPASDNDLYHGLITIPGATGTLDRLLNVVGRPLVVGGRGGSLVLGYQDDSYGDNGYYAHDNGTGNQCLNSRNAFVHIVIS